MLAKKKIHKEAQVGGTGGGKMGAPKLQFFSLPVLATIFHTRETVGLFFQNKMKIFWTGRFWILDFLWKMNLFDFLKIHWNRLNWRFIFVK
jgi:hypothetical protein